MALLALPLWFAAACLLCLVLGRRPVAARWLGYGLAALGGAGALAGAVGLLVVGGGGGLRLIETTPALTLALRVDALAAAFALPLGAATAAVSVAAIGYGRRYDHHGGARLAALYNLFVATMLLVLLADGAFSFLIAWEAMSLVGYLLVAHEHEQAGVRRAAFVYLAMAHLGTAFVVGALVWLQAGAPATDFAGLAAGAARLDSRARDAIFLALLIGFGTKAGLAPLHVWLPRAHPVAPSHVSALMSGVMLKVALYGLVRLGVVVLGAGPSWWGWLLLATGALSALLGVLYALVDRDLKRVLAYSSVENVGIVAIGLGAALVAPGAISALALTAALFHVLNHALFKSLLFVGAGAVDQAVGSRDLDRLGGLARAMPATSALVLVGALAIAAVPPLNGFASEWLTFQALLALGTLDGASAIAAGVAAALLALTGGLAIAGFVRAFGVAFLGRPRAGLSPPGEAPATTRLGLALLAAGCAGLGLLPGLAPALLQPAVDQAARASWPAPRADLLAGWPPPASILGPTTLLWPVGTLAWLLALAAIAWLLLRALGPVPRRRGPVWVCGFDLQPRMAYGSTALTETARLFFRRLLPARWVARPEWELAPYFARGATLQSQTFVLIERHLYGPTFHVLLRLANRLRALQSGNLRSYLLYVFATLLVLLVLAR